MFDLAWSEIALIGVVALVVIGPKDLPEAIRGVARGIAKLRKMAGEFQGQADELVREANLEEVRNTISDIRNFNIRSEIEKAVDKDGSIRKTFTEDPLKPGYEASPSAMEGAGAAAGSAEAAPPKPAPAFIPPAYAPLPPPIAAAPAPPPAPPPSFVPPAEAGYAATFPPAHEPAPLQKS